MRPRTLLLPTTLLFSGLLSGFLPGAARAQPPEVVAETRFDVDGDGAPDVVRIERPPAVVVHLARGRQAWRPFATSAGTLVRGTLTTGAGPRFGGRAVVVATGVFRDGRGERQEAMVLSWQGNELVKLWEGQVGLQGADGEHAVHVEATPLGLLRYQSRPDVQRCDREPSYLFPEAYDFRAGRFRPVFNVPRVPADAPVLVASRMPPPGVTDAPPDAAPGAGLMAPAVAFRTRGASTQAGAASASHLAPPRALDDGDPATAWREDLGGNGRGEFITLTTNMRDVRVAAVRIVPGDASDPAMFRRSNRLARAGLLVGADRAFWIEIPADPAADRALARTYRQPYWVTLPEPIPADCVTLIIDAVYPGSAAASAQGGDTVIADLAVLTDLDLDPGGAEAALVARVLAGGSEGRSAAALLTGRGRPAAEALVQAASARGRTPDELLRLRRALARVGDPLGAPALVEGLAAPGLHAADREDFAAALARMGEDAIAPLAALLADPSGGEPGQRAAVEALGDMTGPAAHQALITAAGRGTRDVRRAVAVRLGQRDPAEMPALLAAAGRARDEAESGREADLWRAIGLMARRAGAEVRARAAAAMAERLDTASGYELLYRLLPAAAHLDHAPLGPALEAALARLPGASAEADALRRVTASALAGNPSPHAHALLLGMLSAPDPGLRRRAAESLGERGGGDAATDRALAARLEADAWPRIRVMAATALGHRCGGSGRDAAPGPEADPRPGQALGRALDTDAELAVRLAALAALVSCQPEGTRLLDIAANRKQPVDVRQRAITLVAEQGERGLAIHGIEGLIELFGQLRRQAWSDADAVRLAAAAAVTLGKLGDPRAVAPLLGAARDEAFPELQAAAITGLGSLCPPELAPLLDRHAGSDQRAVALAVRSARARCQ